jgi:hypothetical protein
MEGQWGECNNKSRGAKREVTSKNSATVMCSKCDSSSPCGLLYETYGETCLFSARFDVLVTVSVYAVNTLNPCPTQGDIFLKSGVLCKYGLDEPNIVWY